MPTLATRLLKLKRALFRNALVVVDHLSVIQMILAGARRSDSTQRPEKQSDKSTKVAFARIASLFTRDKLRSSVKLPLVLYEFSVLTENFKTFITRDSYTLNVTFLNILSLKGNYFSIKLKLQCLKELDS